MSYLSLGAAINTFSPDTSAAITTSVDASKTAASQDKAISQTADDRESMFSSKMLIGAGAGVGGLAVVLLLLKLLRRKKAA